MKTLIPVIAFASVLAACAQPARYETMVMQSQPAISIPEEIRNTVRVLDVTGGSETNPIWTSQVDKDTFKMALTRSLANTGILSTDNTSEASVQADVKELIQPLFGFSFSVTSTVEYKVVTSSKQRLFTVTETGTATAGDALLGVERLRIANERSIQNNIREFIGKLIRFLSE